MTNKIRVCMGTGCISSKSGQVKDKFDKLLDDQKVEISDVF